MFDCSESPGLPIDANRIPARSGPTLISVSIGCAIRPAAGVQLTKSIAMPVAARRMLMAKEAMWRLGIN